jgi:dCTP deaminase
VILQDREIRRLCEEERMIVPFDLEQLNPASYDVLLGNHIMVESVASPELVLVDISDCSKENPYSLAPGAFVLAETFETFNIPDDIAAQFILKSSRGREGLSHALCGYCDPGWHGSKLTLELHSLRQLHPLPLYPGLKIGQLVFTLMAGIPDRSYAETGRYNGDGGVTASKG